MTFYKRFLGTKSGNVALIFALAAVPAASMMAVGVEMTRINDAKAKLDRATDAAALTAKKTQMDNIGLGGANAKTIGAQGGQKSFLTNTNELTKVTSNRALAVTWDTDDSARAVGSADFKLIFGGLLGIDTMRLTSLGVAGSGTNSIYEIALVLDNTASMFRKDGRTKTRFTYMREAATSFVNSTYSNVGAPERLRFSVIPFAISVRAVPQKYESKGFPNHA